jgi:hypothetical protein
LRRPINILQNLLKSLFLVLYATCILIPYNIQAQHNNNGRDTLLKKKFEKMHPVSGVIKTNILPIIWGNIPYTAEYRLLGEFMTTRGQSLSIGASYLGKSMLLILSEKSAQNKGQSVLSVTGYRVQGAYKFYFIKKNLRPEGPYLALHSSWSSARIFEKGNTADYLAGSHFNVNVLFGAQVIAANKVAFDVFLGPGYKNNTWSEHSPGSSKSIDMTEFGRMYSGHLKFTMGFNVGIAL